MALLPAFLAPSLAFPIRSSSFSLARSPLAGPPVVYRRPRRATNARTPVCTSAQTSNVARLRLEIEAVAGAERGLFGQEDEERDALEAIIRAVEGENPTTAPTVDNAKAAAGTWRLLYTNLEILGRRRVRLAIATSRKSGFVKLGEFLQVVDAEKRESKSIVEFKVLTGTSGTFTIVADYEVASARRVIVRMTTSALEPVAFEKLLGENKSLLTEIFNPEGYLDITYVDEALRIGRDDKGHVFVLERVQT